MSTLHPGRHNSRATRFVTQEKPIAEKVTLFSSKPAGAQREKMIAQAAYYNAERRGFGPGHELEDWLAAEQEIDLLLQHTDPEAFLADAVETGPEEPWR